MKVFYEKRGRRYFPVHQYDGDLLSSMPKGAHLVLVQPGSLSTFYNVDADAASLLAALKIARDEVTKAAMKATEARPVRPPLTPRQRKAWADLQAAMRDDLVMLQYESAAGIVDAMEKELMKQVRP